MKNMKFWRTALVATLVLTVMLSVTGGTIAWFTDTVTSGNNVIKSGNLDVELYYQLNGDNSWTEVTETTNVFEADALWEPGHTEVVKFKVVNAGNLALKAQLGVNVTSETGSTNVLGNEFKLSDHIKYGIGDDSVAFDRAEAIDAVEANATALNTTYTSQDIVLENQNEAEIVTMVVYMPTTVGNEANHAKGYAAPVINLGVKLVATQYPSEEDSFDETYDENVQYPLYVSTADELKDALAAGGNVKIVANIEAPTMTIPADKSVVLDLNGCELTYAGTPTGGNPEFALKNEGTLTIQGEGTISAAYAAVYSTGNLTVAGGNFESSNGFGLIVDNIYGTEASVAVINGGTFTGVGVYNPTDVTINGGTFNVGRDPDGATDLLSSKMTLFVSPTFVGAPNTANVTLNGGTFNGDIYVYDDGITETVFTNNGATINGSILDNQ